MSLIVFQLAIKEKGANRFQLAPHKKCIRKGKKRIAFATLAVKRNRPGLQ